ncbi:inorganic phosphate transporter [Alicyclobacillus acidocaldarius]|uniref:inorganic phosphate transporter n=1 Tax=Alicyclobacillus acidocaldarius TaxID=405212 RepID=UPI001ED973EE|nr:inorganic phosphate transporter [Alicyclobacillus acidocaldarius]
MVLAAWLVAMFFAANIGASGTAASMGAAYGAGAIRRKWMALFLVSVFAFLGATLGGGRVVSTISNGIVPSQLVTVEITLIVLAAACTTLFISNVVGVPLSTSEVTVGAVVGAGLAVGHVHAGRLAFIVSMWLVVPFCRWSFRICSVSSRAGSIRGSRGAGARWQWLYRWFFSLQDAMRHSPLACTTSRTPSARSSHRMS